MKEASYGESLATDLETRIGGKCFKISDRSTLGLPDYIHILNGIGTYFEVKIGEEYVFEDGFFFVQPWKVIKKDLRQYEVCKLISKHTLVMYGIYYPEIRRSAVLTIKEISQLRPAHTLAKIPWVNSAEVIQIGYGSHRMIDLIIKHRKEVYAGLSTEYGTSGT